MGKFTKEATLASDCPQGDSACTVSAKITELEKKIGWLSEQVNTDALTQLFNRRHLDAALDQEMERTRRSGAPASIAIIDADHFKTINDSYGHLSGDKVLITLAGIIQNAIRKVDIACRYGGEEFAVILPATPLMVAIQVVERIRSSIAETEFSIESGNINVTVSIGLTSFTGSDTDASAQILARADAELYRAKHEGRNRVCYSASEKSLKSLVSRSEKDALLGEDEDD